MSGRVSTFQNKTQIKALFRCVLHNIAGFICQLKWQSRGDVYVNVPYSFIQMWRDIYGKSCFLLRVCFWQQRRFLFSLRLHQLQTYFSFFWSLNEWASLSSQSHQFHHFMRVNVERERERAAQIIIVFVGGFFFGGNCFYRLIMIFEKNLLINFNLARLLHFIVYIFFVKKRWR